MTESFWFPSFFPILFLLPSFLPFSIFLPSSILLLLIFSLPLFVFQFIFVPFPSLPRFFSFFPSFWLVLFPLVFSFNSLLSFSFSLSSSFFDGFVPLLFLFAFLWKSSEKIEALKIGYRM